MTVKELKEILSKMPEDAVVKAVTKGVYTDILFNSVVDCKEFKKFVGIIYE